MRIGIDARYLSHGLEGGIHTYLLNLLPNLLDVAKEHQIVLYADTKCPFELASPPSNVTVRYLPWRNALSSVYCDLFARRWMEADRLDVVHFPANLGFGPCGARVVITLHDAINVLPLREIIRGHSKAPRSIAMMTYLHYLSVASLRRADLLLTVSGHAKDTIARLGAFERDRIVPIWHAPTPDLRRIDDPVLLAEVRQRYGLVRPFVLADALKNPAVLVQAWRLLPASLRESHEIVFFARRPDVRSVVHESVASGEARLLQRPPRGDLIALYSMARAFVFPSWIEGFGIPVLEAMTCGAPVITSDRGALPEVVGDAALVSGAEDPITLAEYIARVLGDSAVASDLRERGFARAAEFSWQRSARQTLESYERALLE